MTITATIIDDTISATFVGDINIDVDSAALALSGGADLVGIEGGGTVQDAMNALGVQTTFTFDGTELWDNGYWIDRTTHNEHSSMARVVFETEATSVDIDVYANYTPSSIAALHVWVDGVHYASPGLAASSGAQTVTQALPAGHKRVAITAGTQGISAGTVVGIFLVGCEFNDVAAMVPPQAPGRVLVYGDSTSQGSGNTVNIDSAWPTMFRALSPRSLVVEAASSRQLRDDIADGTARAAFIDKLSATKPAAIWIAIGVNDFQNGTWDAATFGTNYGLLLDDLHTEFPNARIYCATPLMKYSELLSSPSRHLESYRQQIRALIYSRANWATLVEGPGILGLDDMLSESSTYIHPNDQGARKYAEYVIATLNGRTLFDRPCFWETEDVDWTNTANVTETGNSLQKNAGSDNVDDAGGTSSQKILAAPWAVRFTVTEVNKLRIFGVSSVSTGVELEDVLYGWSPQAAGTSRPWQDGGNYGYGDTASFTSLSAGTQLQIRCDGTYVYYETIRAGECVALRKASRTVETGDYPLYAKAVLMGSSSTVTDAKMQGPLG